MRASSGRFVKGIALFVVFLSGGLVVLFTSPLWQPRRHVAVLMHGTNAERGCGYRFEVTNATPWGSFVEAGHGGGDLPCGEAIEIPHGVVFECECRK
jgi:hypothetical protein